MSAPCRGWLLVSLRRRTPAEVAAATAHLALCQRCRSSLAARRRRQAAAVGSGVAGTGAGGGIAALVSSMAVKVAAVVTVTGGAAALVTVDQPPHRPAPVSQPADRHTSPVHRGSTAVPAALDPTAPPASEGAVTARTPAATTTVDPPATEASVGAPVDGPAPLDLPSLLPTASATGPSGAAPVPVLGATDPPAPLPTTVLPLPSETTVLPLPSETALLPLP